LANFSRVLPGQGRSSKSAVLEIADRGLFWLDALPVAINGRRMILIVRVMLMIVNNHYCAESDNGLLRCFLLEG